MFCKFRKRFREKEGSFVRNERKDMRKYEIRVKLNFVTFSDRFQPFSTLLSACLGLVRVRLGASESPPISFISFLGVGEMTSLWTPSELHSCCLHVGGVQDEGRRREGILS
jgi:hypothetical protein